MNVMYMCMCTWPYSVFFLGNDYCTLPDHFIIIVLLSWNIEYTTYLSLFICIVVIMFICTHFCYVLYWFMFMFMCMCIWYFSFDFLPLSQLNSTTGTVFSYIKAYWWRLGEIGIKEKAVSIFIYLFSVR